MFVDGYRRPEEFICAEWPMAHTMPAFWSMVYDHDIRTVVVLNHNKDNSGFPQFWPKEVGGGKRQFGPVFSAEAVGSKGVEGRFESWDLKILKQEMAPHK